MLGLINRNILYRSKDIMVPIYKSLVHPHLEYCIVVWSPHYQKDKILLERIQRCFTRMIPGVKKMPYESRLEELKLPSKVFRGQKETCWFNRGLQDDMGFTAVDFSKFFTLDLQSRTRGHSWKLKKSWFNTYLRQHFFQRQSYILVEHFGWRYITVCSVNSFKVKLQKLKDHSDEFLSEHWSPMNSTGQASFPGEANPVS